MHFPFSSVLFFIAQLDFHNIHGKAEYQISKWAGTANLVKNSHCKCDNEK